MATTNLSPASIGNRDSWSLGAGASKPAACALPDDDATSYIEKSAADGSQNFIMEALSSAAGVINRVDHGIRVYRYAGATGHLDHVWEFNGSTMSNCGNSHNPGAAWTEYGEADIARPDPGGAWVPADFDGTATSCRFGVKADTIGAGDGFRCTTVWAFVDWDPTDGGGAYLVGQWLPPLIAVASHCLSKFDITQILSSLKTRPTSNEEFTRIIEAFKRRPAYGFLA